MISSAAEMKALQRAAELERPLQALEDRLDALRRALQQQDADAVAGAAAELHLALAAAMDHFTRAARSGGVPPLLRQRLAQAGGQVAAQREALARATASLDRAIELLLPRAAGIGNLGAAYAAAGHGERAGSTSGGSLLA